jgi:2-hydroxychromene-2-carboxylate isomerase
MPAPRLTFWYEFASSYSYLSAMRIDAAAQAAGVEVVWQPFLLGPIFKAQGWTSSPFNLYPAEGRYMVRDIARIAASRGIAFRLPEPFPANTLRAARLALIGMNEGWGARFSKAVFEAEFAHGLDIASIRVLSGIVAGLGLDSASLMTRGAEPALKDRLRAVTADAQARGIFGAPSFVTPDGELFWGMTSLMPRCHTPSPLRKRKVDAAGGPQLSGLVFTFGSTRHTKGNDHAW